MYLIIEKRDAKTGDVIKIIGIYTYNFKSRVELKVNFLNMLRRIFPKYYYAIDCQFD